MNDNAADDYRKHAMEKTKSKPPLTPEGWHTVTPRIVAHNAEQLVEFVKQVFRAEGEYRLDVPAILIIGDSTIMIGDSGERSPAPAFLYVYVPDADGTYLRALDAGAKSLEEPADMPYGDRRAMVEDRWGNIWQIATYKVDDDREQTS